MSIATELALLANTKEGLRVALKLSKDVPFSQYAVNIPWGSDVIPATGAVFEFQNNRYAKDGRAVYLTDISNFIRLTSATKLVDGQLVSVGVDVPRISGEGLLIEPQRTNAVQQFTRWTLPPPPAETILRTTDAFTFRNPTSQTGAVYTVSGGVVSIKSVYVQASDGGVAWIQSSGVRYDIYTLSASQIRRCKTPPVSVGSWGVFAPLGQNTLRYPQDEEGDQITSYIPVGENPTTRSPDILNIPLLPSQTITGDWDAGVTYEVADNIATFTGHGYIRNIAVEAL